MDRCALAKDYHNQGFNCCQSVLMPFADFLGKDVQLLMDVASGFGKGCGTQEICGAVSGAIMVLGLATPVDPADPEGSKARTVAKGMEFQKRFSQRFESVRCDALFGRPIQLDDRLPEAKRVGMTKGCDPYIVTAVEILQQMLEEEGA